MNILFRKNFAEGGGGSKDRGTAAKSGVRTNRQAKRESEDPTNLRTHIFLRSGHYGVTGDSVPWVSEQTSSGIACPDWDLPIQTQISSRQNALLYRAPSEVPPQLSSSSPCPSYGPASALLQTRMYIFDGAAIYLPACVFVFVLFLNVITPSGTNP